MTTITNYENRRLTVTRVYDAPRAAVFDAWVATSKVEQWWGCANTTNVQSEVEPRLGGKYVHLMTIHGSEYPLNGVISEYDPPALLAYQVAGPNPEDTMTVRVEFIERGSGTEIRLTQDNLPVDISEYVIGGWSAAFGKLDGFLTDQANAA